MLSKNKVKFIQSLKQKKYRYQHRTYVLEGDKLAEELLTYAPERVSELFATEEWLENHLTLWKGLPLQPTIISERELKKISQLKTPNKVLILASMQPEFPSATKLSAGTAAFFLDEVQDPGNLGTILRVADWFGLPDVFCAPGTVDLYNPKVVQASMGAFFRLRVHYKALPDLLEENPGLPVYGAELKGKNVFDLSWKLPCLIVLGNESRGILPETATRIDEFIHIPAGPRSETESLNVGVAAGIIAAVLRQGTGSFASE
jgi:TrmH family RNA methyltransferase